MYWVVTRRGVIEHTDPGLGGYANICSFGHEQEVPVRHAGTSLPVIDVLATGEAGAPPAA